jgi:hypothetical protein
LPAAVQASIQARLANFDIFLDSIAAEYLKRVSRRGEVLQARIERVLAEADLSELDRVFVVGRDRALDQFI